MQDSEDFPGNVYAATVKANTLAKLSELKNPRNTHRIILLNKNGIFKITRVGNVLPLKTLTYGFDGMGNVGRETKVRIKSMKYFDERDECDLNADEVVNG